MQFPESAEFLQQQRFLLAGTGERLTRYATALASAVVPGMVVLDLGAGSGVLSVLAARAGARRVYAVEAHPMAGLVRRLAEANGVADRVVLVQGASDQVTLPEPVDLIVTDTYDCCGLQKDGLRCVSDAVTRFLNPGGRVMPDLVVLHAAPVESARLHADAVTCWDAPREGVDMSCFRGMATHNWYPVWLAPAESLAGPVAVATFRLDALARYGFDAEVRWAMERAGSLHGVAIWFSATLEDGIVIGNSPSDNSTQYRQGFFPLPAAVPVGTGDVVRLQMTGFDSIHWRWRVSIEDAQGGLRHAATDQSTFWGAEPSAHGIGLEGNGL